MIRRAKREDIQQILSIAKQVNEMVQRHRSKFFGTPLEFNRTNDFYKRAMEEEDSVFFVAEVGKSVVGYVYATIEREPNDLITVPHVIVNEIAVGSRHQSSGIGKSLMDRVHEWSQEKGLNVLQLSVWEFNKGAIKFYEKMGYKTIMRKMEKVLK